MPFEEGERRPARLVTVQRFLDPRLAQLERARLAGHGIEAVLRNEHTASIAPHYSFATGGVSLLVAAADEADARRILREEPSVGVGDEWRTAAPLADEVIPAGDPAPAPCPNCAGFETDRIPRLKISVTAAALLLAVGSVVGDLALFVLTAAAIATAVALGPVFRCRHCGNRWRPVAEGDSTP